MVSDVSVQARKMPESERWGQVLGTGCGSVGTGAYRVKATKNAICWRFAKPSDGLELSTPSLPWRFLGGTRVHARAFAATFSLEIRALVRVGNARR
jgi:hypothetical protein